MLCRAVFDVRAATKRCVLGKAAAAATAAVLEPAAVV
jgi:hypothetical protein